MVWALKDNEIKPVATFWSSWQPCFCLHDDYQSLCSASEVEGSEHQYFHSFLGEKNKEAEEGKVVGNDDKGVTENGAEDPDPDGIQVVVEGDSGDDGRRSANRRGKKSKESESKDEVKYKTINLEI